MDIQVLKNFIKIADAKSITLAARQIYISQPSLSNQLRALERELGVTLAIRMPRHLELTPEGEALYRYAQKVTQAEGELLREIRSDGSGTVGSLRIGMFPSAVALLPFMQLKQLTERHPDVNISFYEADAGTLALLLESRGIDLALIRLPSAYDDQLELYCELEPERMIAVGLPGVSSDAGDGTVSLEALCDERLMVSHRLEAALQMQAARIGRSANIVITATNVLTLISLAEQGIGVALVPENYRGYARRQGLCCRDISGLDSIATRMGILKRRAEKPSPLLAELKDILTQALSAAKV